MVLNKRQIPGLQYSMLILARIHDVDMKTLSVIDSHKQIIQTIKDYEEDLFKQMSQEKFIQNVCLSHRHDYGLMNEDEKNKIRAEVISIIRAIQNNKDYFIDL